jgi:hypothetical protein
MSIGHEFDFEKQIGRSILDFYSTLVAQLKAKKSGLEIFKTVEDFENSKLYGLICLCKTNYHLWVLREIQVRLKSEGEKCGRESIPTYATSGKMKEFYSNLIDEIAWWKWHMRQIDNLIRKIKNKVEEISNKEKFEREE